MRCPARSALCPECRWHLLTPSTQLWVLMLLLYSPVFCQRDMLGGKGRIDSSAGFHWGILLSLIYAFPRKVNQPNLRIGRFLSRSSRPVLLSYDVNSREYANLGVRSEDVDLSERHRKGATWGRLWRRHHRASGPWCLGWYHTSRVGGHMPSGALC